MSQSDLQRRAEIKRHVETAASVAVVAGTVVLYCTNEEFRAKLKQGLDLQKPANAGRSNRHQSSTNTRAQTNTRVPYPNVNNTDGVVYLLQAGPFFKIGKTTDFEARIRSIKLQLPYPVTVVHKIETRDISGVESYWHKRFANRRANGEWFTLNDSEVAEFKGMSRM